MHFKNIMRDQESDENIFEYISDDLSWRYVTYLTSMFTMGLLAETAHINIINAFNMIRSE